MTRYPVKRRDGRLHNPLRKLGRERTLALGRKSDRLYIPPCVEQHGQYAKLGGQRVCKTQRSPYRQQWPFSEPSAQDQGNGLPWKQLTCAAYSTQTFAYGSTYGDTGHGTEDTFGGRTWQDYVLG